MINSSSGFQAATGGKMKSKKKGMKGKGQQKPSETIMAASPMSFVSKKKGMGRRKS